jgi:hypothetical protein
MNKKVGMVFKIIMNNTFPYIHFFSTITHHVATQLKSNVSVHPGQQRHNQQGANHHFRFLMGTFESCLFNQ